MWVPMHRPGRGPHEGVRAKNEKMDKIHKKQHTHTDPVYEHRPWITQDAACARGEMLARRGIAEKGVRLAFSSLSSELAGFVF